MTNTNTTKAASQRTATQNGVNVTDMYIVRKNGRKVPNKVFATYEKARQWCRKKLRSMREEPGMFSMKPGDYDVGTYDTADHFHRTPQLALHGYSISKVEG